MPRLMSLTWRGTSKAKVWVGPAAGRPLPPVRVPVNEPPVGPIGTSVRSVTGISGSVLLADGVVKRSPAARSPGSDGILNCATTSRLAPAGRSKFDGDTMPRLTYFSAAQVNWTGPLTLEEPLGRVQM